MSNLGIDGLDTQGRKGGAGEERVIQGYREIEGDRIGRGQGRIRSGRTGRGGHESG